MEMELIGQIGIIPDPDREGSTPVLKRGVVMVAAEGFGQSHPIQPLMMGHWRVGLLQVVSLLEAIRLLNAKTQPVLDHPEGTTDGATHDPL